MFGVIYIIKSILDITNFLQEKVSADIRIRIRSDIIAIPVSRPVIRTIIPIATGQLLYNLYFYFKFTLLKFLVNFRSAFFEKIVAATLHPPQNKTAERRYSNPHPKRHDRNTSKQARKSHHDTNSHRPALCFASLVHGTKNNRTSKCLRFLL